MNEKVNIEPSMDEILASIRQIIADPSKKDERQPFKENTDEDILDLTNLLPEETNSSSPHKPQLVSQSYNGKSKPVKKSLTQPVVPQLREGSATLEQDDLMTLLKEKREGSSKESFLKIDKTSIGNQTIEELVQSSLNPLLKEWLNIHLPSIVREVVGEQVEKIIRQMGK